MRVVYPVLSLALAIACGGPPDSPPGTPTDPPAQPARDDQHKGVTGPHGDHTPHHGGMVLMNGDVHYEVVLAKDGRHQVWFSDAMRNDLPASIAAGVTMEVARPDAAVETVRLAIDEAGEAWIAMARPLVGAGILIKVRYTLQGAPYEIELPFVEANP